MKERKNSEMTEEEFSEIIDNMDVQLQGAVMAPETQMLYGPPLWMNRQGGMEGFMTMPGFAAANCSWLDDTRWKCSCGQENAGKYCAECGSPAPPKEWVCPGCGTANQGNFCGECGTKKP